MANIGDTVSFTASKYKNLFVSDDKRYTIAYFTVNARDARLYLPQDAKTKQYGTTHMFIVKGFIPDGIDNIAYEQQLPQRQADSSSNRILRILEKVSQTAPRQWMIISDT